MLKVTNLCKDYGVFKLDNVSFELDDGLILGFIGANGAGKTTTLKCMLNLVHADGGEVEIDGVKLADDEKAVKRKVGLSFGEADFYNHSKVADLAKVYSRFFGSDWSQTTFENYLQKFSINPQKRINQLSAGMRVKLSLSFSLSHNARLLVLDEPTSGLDPVAREDLQDVFREIVSDGNHSIIFSTHITSDLDRCADMVLFIKNGKIIANETKDDLIDTHILVQGKKEQLSDAKKWLIGYKENAFGFLGLAKTASLEHLKALQTERPNLEDIMVFYIKEETK